jgi:Nitrile hydratase, alpha chain
MTTSDDSGRWSDPEQQVIDRAMRDPDFRSRLLETPRAAIQEELGTAISSSTRIRVVEEQLGEVILVLPARPMEPGATISDEDLEQAAGGALNTNLSYCGTCSGQSTCAVGCG